MAIVGEKIGELDLVELRQPVEGWPVGTRAAVLAQQGDLKLIEISDDQGVALDDFPVSESQLKLISKNSR